MLSLLNEGVFAVARKRGDAGVVEAMPLKLTGPEGILLLKLLEAGDRVMPEVALRNVVVNDELRLKALFSTPLALRVL